MKFLGLVITLMSLHASAHPFLIGGEQAETTQFRSTVHLALGCTASKVASKTFMLAAHCVLNQYGENSYNPGSIIVIKTHYGITATTTVKKVFAHESYATALKNKESNSQGFQSYDIALIAVNEKTPEIPVVAIDYEKIKAGEKVVIGGYGCEKNALDPDGRRLFKIALTKVASSSVISKDYYGRDISRANEFNFYTKGKAMDSESGSICPGDSGGPVYRNSNNSVIGVNSLYIFKDNSAISYVNTHTRVSEVADWIKPKLK